MAFLRFEDLRVFKLAEKLCDDIWDIVTSWKYFEKNAVGSNSAVTFSLAQASLW